MKWILIVIILNWNTTQPAITVQELSSRAVCLTVKESIYKSIEKQPFIADIKCLPDSEIEMIGGYVN